MGSSPSLFVFTPLLNKNEVVMSVRVTCLSARTRASSYSQNMLGVFRQIALVVTDS
jgi:hypothetical protein